MLLKHTTLKEERKSFTRPVVTSWLIPSTDTVAFAMAFPCWSFTMPLIPRCTWTQVVQIVLEYILIFKHFNNMME